MKPLRRKARLDGVWKNGEKEKALTEVNRDFLQTE